MQLPLCFEWSIDSIDRGRGITRFGIGNSRSRAALLLGGKSRSASEGKFVSSA